MHHHASVCVRAGVRVCACACVGMSTAPYKQAHARMRTGFVSVCPRSGWEESAAAFIPTATLAFPFARGLVPPAACCAFFLPSPVDASDQGVCLVCVCGLEIRACHDGQDKAPTRTGKPGTHSHKFASTPNDRLPPRAHIRTQSRTPKIS